MQAPKLVGEKVLKFVSLNAEDIEVAAEKSQAGNEVMPLQLAHAPVNVPPLKLSGGNDVRPLHKLQVEENEQLATGTVISGNEIRLLH